jgi:outer membrane protein TolC
MVNQLLQSDPSSTLQNRITDVDMLILVKEIESLQTKILEQYYTYKHTEQHLAQAQDSHQTMEKLYQKIRLTADSASLETYQSLIDTLLSQAEQQVHLARQSYQSARGSLSLMVGPDALSVIEHPDQKRS